MRSCTYTCTGVLFYSLQNGDTLLHLVAKGHQIITLERLLSTPGIDVNIKDKVCCPLNVKFISEYSGSSPNKITQKYDHLTDHNHFANPTTI